MLIIVPSHLISHMAAAVLGHCRTLRNNGLPIPLDLGRLRDELMHQAASGGLQVTPFDLGLAPAEPVTMSVPEAARRLNLSVRTLRRMTADGRLGVVRVGRRVLVPVAQLEAFTNGKGVGA